MSLCRRGCDQGSSSATSTDRSCHHGPLGLKLLDVLNDLLNLLTNIAFLRLFIFFKLFKTLMHLLHGILDVELRFRDLPLQGTESVCEIFDISPRPISLGLLDFGNDGLVVSEVLVV